MSGPEAWDEFDLIARLFRPLAADAPEALGLLDDAALIQPPAGKDLVVTTDVLIAGVHFLSDDPLDAIARKALRVNLSDLAAKGAEPYGYLLNLSWPTGQGGHDAFARGLGEDQAAFGLKLFGGDTSSTPGPLTVGVTMFGLVETGGMVRRDGAKAGQRLLVSGPIGDGFLGLKAARGELDGMPKLLRAYLADCYRLPKPRTDLCPVVRELAAAADISDGLLADAGRIAEASGVGAEIDLDAMPLSDAAAWWVDRQSDRSEALIALASGGDDYEIVAAGEPAAGFTGVGRVVEGRGVSAWFEDRPLTLAKLGFRHGKDG